MCDFTCRFFGASYPDAICIDGLLWDCDSGDEDGYLTSGGETPCPSCDTAGFLAHFRDQLVDDIPNPGERTPAESWEDAIRFCLSVSPGEVAPALRATSELSLLDTPGRVASPEREDPDPDLSGLVWRRWPWRIAGLSAHRASALLAAASLETGKDSRS